MAFPTSFLGKYSLGQGAMFSGIFMAAFFGVIVIGCIALLADWGSVFVDLKELVGLNPSGGGCGGVFVVQTPSFLRMLHPMGLVVFLFGFTPYSLISGAMAFLVVVKSKSSGTLIGIFLIASLATLMMCNLLEAYVLLRFEWCDTSQLGVMVAASVIFYIWWAYCILVTYTYWLSKEENAGGQKLPESIRHGNIAAVDIVNVLPRDQ